MNSDRQNISAINDSDIAEPLFLTKVIRTAGRENLRKKLIVIGENYFKTHEKKAESMGNLKEFKTKIQDIFLFYFSPYENLITVRSNKAKDILLQEAMSLYSLKDYSGAVKLLRKHLVNNPEDPLSQFYLGISLMATDKFDNASVIFKRIIKKGNPLLTEHSKWYLALSNLSNFNLHEAVIILNEISEKTSYSRKASNLKKKISSL